MASRVSDTDLYSCSLSGNTIKEVAVWGIELQMASLLFYVSLQVALVYCDRDANAKRGEGY